MAAVAGGLMMIATWEDLFGKDFLGLSDAEITDHLAALISHGLFAAGRELSL